jgi:hypothetical protein
MFMVGGYYLAFFFSISHNFEGVHMQEDTSRESNAKKSFLHKQVGRLGLICTVDQEQCSLACRSQSAVFQFTMKLCSLPLVVLKLPVVLTLFSLSFNDLSRVSSFPGNNNNAVFLVVFSGSTIKCTKRLSFENPQPQ